MLTALFILLALVWGLDALRLRRRAAALPRLAPSDEPVDPRHDFVVAPGVELDEATRRAASAHARREGLEVLDLVPADLPAWRALMLLGSVDPRAYRKGRIHPGRTAGVALLVSRAVRARAGDAADLFRLAAELKRHAPAAGDLAIARPCRVVDDRATRRALVASLFGDAAPALLLLQAGLVLLALAGPLLAPLPGAVALAALHLQLLVATAGGPLSPRGLARFTLLRAPLDLLAAVRLHAAPRRAAAVAALRPTYQALVVGGVDRFFEPRREDCPLCGGRDLVVRLRTGDLVQRKPGRFVVEECRGCGHLFQNPRLSIAGLEFYYRDFYDGLDAARADALFGFGAEPYVARARAVGEVAPAPARWLDVGAGHGHFCNVARDLLPGTRFDGLDLGEGIDAAARRGWIDRAFRGLFPELAPRLAGEGYDVVSMSHYLEHTRDPRAELRAAATVLAAGGHLMIEIPDPESKLGALLGRFWVPWFQPQHQHLLSVARLERLLAEEGFETVRVQRGDVHIPVDFRAAAWLLLGRLSPGADLPWRPAPGAARRLLAAPFWVAGGVLLAAAHLADRALAPALRRPGWSNAFRVVARRAYSLRSARMGSTCAARRAGKNDATSPTPTSSSTTAA